MKKNKRYNYLIFIVLPVLYFFAMWLLRKHPDAIMSAFKYADWFALGVCALLIITPWGSRQLCAKNIDCQPISNKQWLLRIAAIELGFILTFLGVHQFVFHILPIAQQPISVSQTLSTFWFSYALYPFGIMALFACFYAYISFHQQRDAFIARMPQSLFGFKDTSAFANVHQVTIRNASTISLGLLFCIAALWSATLMVNGHQKMMPTGLDDRAYFTAMLTLVFIFLPPVRRLIAKLFQRRLPAIFGIAATCIIIGLVVLILGTLFYGVHSSNAANIHSKTLTLIKHIGPENLWLMFAASLLLSLTPICSVFLGYFSRGRSIRTTLLATLALPIMIAAIAYYCWNVASWHVAVPGWLTSIASSIGFIILLSQITPRNTQGLLILSMIPKNGRLKYRDHHLFYRRCFQIAAAAIYCYLPIGLPYTAMIIFLVAVPIFILLALCIVGMLQQLATQA